MKKTVRFLAVILTLALFVTMSTPVFGMEAGTYEQSVTGMHDGLVVEVVLTDDAIESVTVLENQETSPGWPALELIPAAIVEHQTYNVDSVAGATLTSEAIKEAVKLSLEDAGADMDAFGEKPEPDEAVVEDYFPVMGSFEVPETFDESYDIVVVGGGFAGLAAAYAAVESGAETTLVEKLSTTGGNSSINGGQYAAWTSSIAAEFQEKFNLEPDTAENHIQDTLIGGDLMGQPELVETMVYAGAAYFDLLLENGLVVRDVLARPGGHYSYRMYVTENQVGSDITNLQREMLERTEADIQLDTKMVEIYRTRDDDNRVVGIRVATPDGYKTIEAKEGVILATGGFGANLDMRKVQVPYLDETIPTTNNVAVSTGEGIMLAQAIGANTMQMSNIQRYPFANPANGMLDSYAVWPFTGPSYGVIYVDYEGNRYVNEGERRDVCSNAAVDTGFPSTYMLFNEDVVLSYALPEELSEGVAIGRVLKGETLEEHAEAANNYEIHGLFPTITADNLAETIERHNAMIDSGVDDEFGKVMAATMIKIESGPYYLLPQYPSVHHTMGGLVIDKYTQVYDIYGDVISGLYAAGEVTGGVHGTNRLGSNADADACGMGYVSGHFVATGEMPEFIPAD